VPLELGAGQPDKEIQQPMASAGRWLTAPHAY